MTKLVDLYTLRENAQFPNESLQTVFRQLAGAISIHGRELWERFVDSEGELIKLVKEIGLPIDVASGDWTGQLSDGSRNNRSVQIYHTGPLPNTVKTAPDGGSTYSGWQPLFFWRFISPEEENRFMTQGYSEMIETDYFKWICR